MAEQDFQKAELPVAIVGMRLANARQAAGLSRSELADSTRIAERHLASIEEGRFSDLASRAYAVGFARTYARALGLDENEIVQAVREELAANEDAARQGMKPAVFEPGDPTRVPGVSLAGAAALGVLLVVVLVFVFWRSYYIPEVSLPDLVREEKAPPPAVVRRPPVAPVPQAPAASGPVVFTALAPNVWVKFYDGSGKQLMQKQMAQGESYTVPADAQAPQIWTGQPDQLQIAIGGKPVPPLADKRVVIKDVPVSAAALLGRQPVAAAAVTGIAQKPAVSPVPATAAAKPAKVARSAPASSLSASSAIAPAPAPVQAGQPAGAPAEASTVSQ